jgi:hypothetical protein
MLRDAAALSATVGAPLPTSSRLHLPGGAIMRYVDAVGVWIRMGLSDSWAWVTSLNYQEWFLLLGITSAAGFLCMRGFGSRSEY